MLVTDFILLTIEPYLAPIMGALALYVYLFMEEKIEFHHGQ